MSNFQPVTAQYQHWGIQLILCCPDGLKHVIIQPLLKKNTDLYLNCLFFFLIKGSGESSSFSVVFLCDRQNSFSSVVLEHLLQLLAADVRFQSFRTLSAAFDTVDYSILLHRSETWVGIKDSALILLCYLSNTTLSVALGSSSSLTAPVSLWCSVLCPLLFLHVAPRPYYSEKCCAFHFYTNDALTCPHLVEK